MVAREGAFLRLMKSASKREMRSQQQRTYLSLALFIETPLGFAVQVGERVREVAPQSSSIIDGTDPRNEEMEGFVCPTCFQRLSSPEQLEKHYSEQHLDPSANYLCPVCKARLNSQSDLEVHYTANHGDKDFNNHSLESLREELMELSTNLREERWYSEELRKEVERLQEAFKKKGDNEDSAAYVHQSQLDAVEESKKLLSSEVVLLRKQLSEALEQMSYMRGEKELLEQRASDFAVEKAELRSTLDSLQEEKVVLDSEVEDVKYNLAALEKSKKEELEKLRNEFGKSENIIESKSKEIQMLKDNENALQHDLKVKSEASAALKQEIRDLKFEIDLMKKKLQEKYDESTVLHARLEENERLLNSMKAETSTNAQESENKPPGKVENQSKSEGGETEASADIARKDQEIEELKSSLSESEKDKSHAQQLLKEKMKLIDDLGEEIFSKRNLISQKEDKIGELEASVQEREAVVQRLQKATEELDMYRESLRKVTHEKECLEEEIRKQQSVLSEMDKIKSNTEKELAEVKEKLTTSVTGLENTKAELRKFLEALSKRDETVLELETRFNEIVSEKDILGQRLSCAVQEIDDQTKTISSLQSDKISLEKEAESLGARLTSVESQMENNAEEKTNLQNRIIRFEKEMAKVEEEHQEACSRLTNQITVLEHTRNALREENDALQFSLKGLLKEKRALEAQNDELADEAAKFAQDIREKEETENKLNETIRGIQVEASDFKDKSSQLVQEITFLQNKIYDLEETAKNEQSRMSELEGRLAAQEAEMAGLAGDKLELEVKVEAAAEEQKGLVERCVAAEAEVERLQLQLTQLRRKLDDSTAALHELGRENQSLQMETAKLSGRKWAEDSEVVDCTRCKKIFSMTVRRHHCRNCYQIFCNDCSSRQIPLEQSKRPVRVCDACHSEILAKH